jgi:hypothetical protein
MFDARRPFGVAFSFAAGDGRIWRCLLKHFHYDD